MLTSIYLGLFIAYPLSCLQHVHVHDNYVNIHDFELWLAVFLEFDNFWKRVPLEFQYDSNILVDILMIRTINITWSLIITSLVFMSHTIQKFAFLATFYIKYFTCQPLSIGMFSKVWRNEKLQIVFLVDIYDYNDLVSCSSGTCLEQG